MKKIKSNSAIFLLLLAVAGIFITDLLFPLGMVLGFSYILILFVASRLVNKNQTIILAVISSLALAADLFISHGIISSYALFNRVFAVVLLWLITFILIRLKKTEIELQESELHYRKIVESTNDGVLIVDEKGDIKFGNQRISNMLGYNVDEINRINFNNLVKSKSFETFPDKFYEYELNLNKKDGSEIFANINFIPLNQLRNIKEHLIVVWDISERKKTEEALKESQARLSGIVSSAMDAIITINNEQNIVLFNKAAEKMFGYSESEVIGKNLNLLVPVALRELHRQHVKNFGKTGVTNRHMGALGAVKGMKKDGTEFPIEASISQIETSGHKFYTVILRDITERKFAEQRLLESENRFRNMADNAPVFIWLSDKAINLVYFNKTWLDFTGRTIDQERNLGWLEILHPEDKESIGKIIKSSLERREPFIIEYRILRKDGEYRWILNQGIPRFTAEGRFVGYIGSAVDITERKIFEEQLNASLKEKEILIKEVHHRVKNNLQIISSLLNLQSEHIHDEKMIDLLIESQNRIKSMALIHEKLYQTKALAKINLKEYITELINNLLISYLPDINLVKLELEIDNIELDIDSGINLGLIVNELVSNILKYAFPSDFSGEKKISVSLKKDEDKGKIKLRVIDSGVGIPVDFDLSKSESLGMQLVDTLTSQLEGEFKFYSNNGTHIEILF